MKETEVYCTLYIEGSHHWPDCPFEEVSYLRAVHRHVFHIKAYAKVDHDNRDIEFIRLKRQITDYLLLKYATPPGCTPVNHNARFCEFGAMSCEMIGAELMDVFELSKVDVSEDGENGSIITKHNIEEV